MTPPSHASRRWLAISTLPWTIVLLLLTNLAWSFSTAWWVDHNDLFFRQHFDLGVTITEQQPPRIREVVRITSPTRTAYWVGDVLYPPMNYLQASERSAESLMPWWCPGTITLPPGVVSTENKSLTYVAVGWPFRLLWCRATSEPSSIVLALGGSNTVGGYRTHEQPPPPIWPRHPLWPGQLATFALIFPLVLVLRMLVFRSRSAYRRYRHRCPNCGYNLHLNTTGVCPECGSIMEPEKRPSHVRRASNRHVVISTFLLTLGLLLLTDIAWAFAFEPLSTRLGRLDAIVQSRICGASVCSDNPEFSNLAFAARSRDVSVFFLRTITTPDEAGVKAWPLIDGSVPGGYNALVPRSLRAAYGAHESAENRRKDYGMLAWTVGWPFRMLWCSEYYTQFDRKPRDLTYAMLSADLADHLPAWLAKRDQYLPYRPIITGHVATGSIYFLLIWFFRYGYRVTLRLIRRYRHRCPNCGYNLHLNTTGVCPECGTAISIPITKQ